MCNKYLLRVGTALLCCVLLVSAAGCATETETAESIIFQRQETGNIDDASDTDKTSGEKVRSESTSTPGEPTVTPTAEPAPTPQPTPTPTPSPTPVPKTIAEQLEHNFGVSAERHEELTAASPSKEELSNTTIKGWKPFEEEVDVTFVDGAGQVDSREVYLSSAVQGLEYAGTPATAVSIYFSGGSNTLLLIDKEHNVLTEFGVGSYFDDDDELGPNTARYSDLGLIGGAGTNLMVTGGVQHKDASLMESGAGASYKLDLSEEEVKVVDFELDLSCSELETVEKYDALKTPSGGDTKTYANNATRVNGPPIAPDTTVTPRTQEEARYEVEVEEGVCVWLKKGSLLPLDYEMPELGEGVAELSGRTIMGIPLDGDLQTITELLEPILGVPEYTYLDNQPVHAKFGENLLVGYPVRRGSVADITSPLTWSYRGGFAALINGQVEISGTETIDLEDLKKEGDMFVGMGGADSYMECNVSQKLCLQYMPDWSDWTAELSSCQFCRDVELTAKVLAQTGPVNLRSGPGVDYDIVGGVYPGDEVVVFEGSTSTLDYTWRQIFFEDTLAFIADDFLDLPDS